jgi:hypothetical protein
MERSEEQKLKLADDMLSELKPWEMVAKPPLGLTYLLRCKQVAWRMKKSDGEWQWMPYCKSAANGNACGVCDTCIAGLGERKPGVEETDSEWEKEKEEASSVLAAFFKKKFVGSPGDCADPVANPNLYLAAARAINEADFVLVCAGAGFSEDSRLPVYDEIASNLYKGYEYSDLCRPELMVSDPSLFYGFWGHCFNLSCKTMPHVGYATLLNCIRSKNYYIYTSNVDGHFRHDNLFMASRVHEIHGCLNRWMCEAETAADEEGIERCQLVSAPTAFRFPIGS